MVTKKTYSFALTDENVKKLEYFKEIFNLKSRSEALEVLISEVLEELNIYGEDSETEKCDK